MFLRRRRYTVERGRRRTRTPRAIRLNEVGRDVGRMWVAMADGGRSSLGGLIVSNSMANRRRSNNEIDVLESVSELNPLKHALFAVPGYNVYLCICNYCIVCEIRNPVRRRNSGPRPWLDHLEVGRPSTRFHWSSAYSGPISYLHSAFNTY